MKKILLYIFAFYGVLFLVIGCVGLLIASPFLVRYEQMRNANMEMYREMAAKPLPQDVVDDLCARDLVPADLADCDASPVVILRGDAGRIFEANLTPGVDSIKEALSLFGPYLDSCDSLTCAFLLAEWPAYPIIIIYYDEDSGLIELITKPHEGLS